MRIAQNYRKHVFCLEGDWENDLRDTSSIRAALSFLKQNFGIKYIYKQCGTKENLEFYLSQWSQKKYKDYSICYLAFHGEPENIEIRGESLSLEELADMLADSCKDKIIHFGTCETLKVDHKRIIKFLENTGALCVCGYKSQIDFLNGSVFDMLLIDMFQKYKDVSKLKEYMDTNYRQLVKKLEFKLVHL